MLDGSTAAPRVFDQRSVQTIRRTRSPGRDALRGLGIGALGGALAGAGIVARLGDADAEDTFKIAAAWGAIFGGIGAAISAVSPSYQFLATRDIYLDGTPSASQTAAIMIAPEVTIARRGVIVTVRF